MFANGNARLEVCATPGSTQVLDRTTMTLVPCDEDLCRFAEYYEDIGWVNRAPYLAFGGWYVVILVVPNSFKVAFKVVSFL